jgi:hypothetical protein
MNNISAKKNEESINSSENPDTGQSKVLSVYPPRIKGRLHHALPLSIIPDTDPNFDEWFYSNYIQLVCNPGPLGAGELNFYEAFVWNHKYPHFQVISLRRANLPMFRMESVDFVKSVVSHNYYVHLYVNEYHLPLQFHNQKEVIRDILIFGFDDAEQELYVMGYTKDQTYGQAKIKYSDFSRSFQSISEDMADWAQDLYLYKQRFDIPYCFSLENVAELIEDYLQSNDTSRKFKGITNKQDYIYGKNAVNTYIQSLRTAKQNYRNPAALYIFWEHKKIMKQRIQFLIERYPSESAKLEQVNSDYETIVIRAERVRLGIMKFNITCDYRIISSIADELEAIIEEETELLGSLLEIALHLIHTHRDN